MDLRDDLGYRKVCTRWIPKGYPGIDGRIILRWLFRKWNVGVWTGLIWPRIETGGGRL